MPKADGTIVIDTAIQDAGFKAGTKELEMACRRAANSVSDIGDKSRVAMAKAVNAFAKQNDAIRQQEEKVDSLKRKLEEMGSEQVETEAFSAVNTEIDRLYKKLDTLDAKKARFLATGGNESSNAFQKLEYDASLIAEELDKAISKKNELLAGGGAYTNADVSRVAQQLAIEQAKLDQQTKNLNVSFASLNQRIEQYKQNSDNASKSTGTLEKSFSSGIKQALKYGLGIRSLYVLTNKLRSALKEGLSNYLEFDPGAKAAVDKFNNSLTQLKNSVATAFLPIISVVGPILAKLIEWLSTAATYVSMFFSALSGKDTYVKAIAIQNDYAGALNNTAAAAKEAQKNLSGLDEITTWQNNKAGGGAGGGTSGSGGNMFTEEKLPSGLAGVTKWGEEIKKIFDTLTFEVSDVLFNWDNLSGTDIIKKVITGLGMVTGGFIGAATGGVSGAIAGALLGLVVTTLLNSLLFDKGSNNLNSKAQKVLTIITTLGFTIFGGAIGGPGGAILGLGLGLVASAGLNSLLFKDGTDEEKTKQRLRRVLEAALVVFAWFTFGPTGLIAGIALSAIIEGSIGNIKIQAWKPMGPTLAEKFRKEASEGAAKGLTALGITLEKNGSDVIAHLRDGLTSGLKTSKKTIESAVDSNLAQPIINKFESTMQIHSPSKVSEGWAKYIIMGLLNGFKNNMNLVLTWVPSFGSILSGKFTSIGDNIATTFQNMKNNVYSIFDGLKNVLRTPLNGIIGFLNRLISGVVSGVNTAIRAINRIKVTIPSWIPKVGGKSIGFNLSTITAPTIPYLATGAVIPPNAPFTAVLGDQRNGTNLEAPESLIRKIVREESGGGNYRFTAQINRRTLFDEMISEAKIRQSTTGKNPFAMT